MNKNNLVRFAQALIILPLMTGTMPGADVPKVNSIEEKAQVVFNQKPNTNLFLLAFNKIEPEEDEAEKIRKVRAAAIDTFYKERSMPLEGMGMKMVLEAEKYNLDWRLLPAIATRESSGGKQACRKDEHNAFGWGSCKIHFDTTEQAIETVARNISGNNPKTAAYYADKSTYEILQAYNPPSIVRYYAEQVIDIMDMIGDKDLTVSSDTSSA